MLGGSSSSGSAPDLTRLDAEEEQREEEAGGGAGGGASSQQDAAVNPAAASSEGLAETLPEVQQTSGLTCISSEVAEQSQHLGSTRLTCNSHSLDLLAARA